jgi:hypothetical protein
VTDARKLIPLTDIAAMQAAGLPWKSVDQVRWAERSADGKGLRGAFITIGRRIYIDPDRFHELSRQFSDGVGSAESGRARHTASQADSGHFQSTRKALPNKPAPAARAVGVAPHLTPDALWHRTVEYVQSLLPRDVDMATLNTISSRVYTYTKSVLAETTL